MFQTHRVDACILLDFASSAFDVYNTKHTLYKMVVNRKSIKVIGLERLFQYVPLQGLQSYSDCTCQK